MEHHELVEALRGFFAEVDTLSLSTVDNAGLPHAANVFCAADEWLNLYFVSDADSAHGQNIGQRPQIAAAGYVPVDNWHEIHGVQLRGECMPISEDQWDAVWGVYVSRFPAVAELQAVARMQQFYRIEPDWLRWIDNRVEFGFKVETDWPAGDEINAG